MPPRPGAQETGLTWLLLAMGPHPAADNMAVDEALLEFVSGWNKPVLRFYSWSEPAASFGYFQRYREVEGLTKLRPLVRRPTGGGVVPHDSDWTYSLAFPPSAPWYQLKALDSYQRVHAWIQEAFARAGVSTRLAEPRATPSSGQCFVGAERFDVVLENQKIAGAAQRRTRQGLLIQGSIQAPHRLRADWEKAFLDLAGVRWEPLMLDARFEARVRELAANKYGQEGYNQRR